MQHPVIFGALMVACSFMLSGVVSCWLEARKQGKSKRALQTRHTDTKTSTTKSNLL